MPANSTEYRYEGVSASDADAVVQFEEYHAENMRHIMR